MKLIFSTGNIAERRNYYHVILSCFFKLFFPFQEHCTKQAHIWNESSSPFIHTESTQILRHCWLELHLTRFWPKDHILGQILDYNSQNLNQTASKKPFCLLERRRSICTGTVSMIWDVDECFGFFCRIFS